MRANYQKRKKEKEKEKEKQGKRTRNHETPIKNIQATTKHS